MLPGSIRPSTGNAPWLDQAFDRLRFLAVSSLNAAVANTLTPIDRSDAANMIGAGAPFCELRVALHGHPSNHQAASKQRVLPQGGGGA
jgi:hypothetical protein